MFEFGLGTTKNTLKAIQYYQRGNAVGDARSSCNLGIALLIGEIVPKDNKKAIELISNAADKNFKHCQYELGYQYYLGENIEQDYKKQSNITAKLMHKTTMMLHLV